MKNGRKSQHTDDFSHFKVSYDSAEIAEVSWAFIREMPPRASATSRRTGRASSFKR
jgi:hypothetical protein